MKKFPAEQKEYLSELTEKDVTKQAIFMKKRLEKKFGGKWNIKVWYNLWWTSTVYLDKGTISVCYNQFTHTFSGYFSCEENNSATPVSWYDCNTYKTPEKAANGAWKKFTFYVEEVTGLLKKNTNAINNK